MLLRRNFGGQEDTEPVRRTSSSESRIGHALTVYSYRYYFTIPLHDFDLIRWCCLTTAALLQYRLVNGQSIRSHEISECGRVIPQFMWRLASESMKEAHVNFH